MTPGLEVVEPVMEDVEKLKLLKSGKLSTGNIGENRDEDRALYWTILDKFMIFEIRNALPLHLYTTSIHLKIKHCVLI